MAERTVSQRFGEVIALSAKRGAAGDSVGSLVDALRRMPRSHAGKMDAASADSVMENRLAWPCSERSNRSPSSRMQRRKSAPTASDQNTPCSRREKFLAAAKDRKRAISASLAPAKK